MFFSYDYIKLLTELTVDTRCLKSKIRGELDQVLFYKLMNIDFERAMFELCFMWTDILMTNT